MNTEQNVLEVSGVEITKTLLVDLQKLSSYSGEPISAIYADNLLRTNLDNLVVTQHISD